MVDVDPSCFQRFRLGQRARHTIQNKAILTVGTAHPLRDDIENNIVGNEAPFVHDLLLLQVLCSHPV